MHSSISVNICKEQHNATWPLHAVKHLCIKRQQALNPTSPYHAQHGFLLQTYDGRTHTTALSKVAVVYYLLFVLSPKNKLTAKLKKKISSQYIHKILMTIYCWTLWLASWSPGLSIVDVCTFSDGFCRCSSAGVSNTRPVGRMRPLKQFYAARNNLPKMPTFAVWHHS